MKKILFLFFIYSISTYGGTQCYRLEGLRIKDPSGALKCTSQAQPAECGPPKQCPPCTFFKSCGTKQRATSSGGICLAYKCEGEPIGDTGICPNQVCISYSAPVCSVQSVSCGNDPTPVPSTGTYSCSYTECRCQVPPGEDVVDCGTSEVCSGDQSC